MPADPREIAVNVLAHEYDDLPEYVTTLARALLAALDEREAMVRAAKVEALREAARNVETYSYAARNYLRDCANALEGDAAAIARLEARIK